MPESITHSQPDITARVRSRVESKVCALCGLPINGKRRAANETHFCCPGCARVFQVLTSVTGTLPSDFRDSNLFRACMEAGIIPGGRTSGDTRGEIASSDEEVSPLSIKLNIAGMWCPACAWLIEELLTRKEGIASCRVSFFTDSASIEYLPHRTSPAELMEEINSIGYKASQDSGASSQAGMHQHMLIRLGVSSILTVNIMMLSYAVYAGFFRSMSSTVSSYFGYPLFLLTVPVVFYGGAPILRKALLGLKHGLMSMDTLIFISVLSAFCYSVIRMIQGSPHTYFDTAAMLITIVLFGRYLETKAHERVAAAFFDETSLAKVRLRINGADRWVNTAAADRGDRFLIMKTEYIPLDGCVVEGEAIVDQSALTGESRHVAKRTGDPVMAGSFVLDGNIEASVTRPSSESMLQQMKSVMQMALERTGPAEELSDRISRFFVPGVFCIAGIAALALWFSGRAVDSILLRCMTILLISCPCTLGIAIPLAKTVSIGLGRKMGVLVLKPDALPKIRRMDTMVLDKTGTVTEGSLKLRQVLCDVLNEREVLSFLSGIEEESQHFVAREIRRRAAEIGARPMKAGAIEEIAGMGIISHVGKARAFAGNRRLLSHLEAWLPAAIHLKAVEKEQEGMTVFFFGWDGETKGVCVFGDPVKDGARELVRFLEMRGITVVLLSGDANKTTGAVAASLGIRESAGEMLPLEKIEYIKGLQWKGHVVGMAGDGINDSGALAQADVGFALAPVYEITRSASDFIIPSGSPGVIKRLFPLALLSERTTRQNLLFSFLYNAAAIPVAVAGLLNPLFAVFAMFASSLTVVGNGLRLGSKRVSDRILRDTCSGEGPQAGDVPLSRDPLP